MSVTAIRASALGKRYWLGAAGQAARRKSLRESLVSLVKRQHDTTFWALKDITFDVKAGEAVGVIGHNGAGKSTLLKILSRITVPTEGAVTIRGRVGSLLEIGTGFHPDLTGRENVYLNGVILGMKRAEIARKFDEIVSFAEIEKFLDVAVKHYSSGMFMRLAFSVAAHLDLDILIVDEVLAVGDLAFQKKCLGKVGAVASQGRTVLFVSHNLGAVRTLCTRALVLGGGRLQFDGGATDAVTHYLTNIAPGEKDGGQITFAPNGLEYDGLNIHSVRLRDGVGAVRSLFDCTETICIEIEYEARMLLRGVRTVLTLSTQEGDVAFQSTDHLARESEQGPGRYKTSCAIPGRLLNRRTYLVEMSFDVPGVRVLAPRRPYVSLVVAGGGNHGSTFPEAWPGIICPGLEWTTQRL